MRRADWWAGVLALVVVAGPALAEVPDLPFCRQDAMPADPMNPQGEASLRLATIARWEAAGPRASSQDLLQLGALYRLGRSHPAGLLSQDVGKARILLANAALQGQVVAMASSAELELKHGDPMAAMVWAQVYSHYSERESPGRYRTYQADLLKRAFDALPRGKQTQTDVEELVAGFLAKHGARMEEALDGPRSARAEPDCRHVAQVYETHLELEDHRIPLVGGHASVQRHRLYEPGLALYRLLITPSGRVDTVHVIESLPDATTGRGMLRTVQKLRFNAIDGNAPLREVLMPMSYDDESVRFRD